MKASPDNTMFVTLLAGAPNEKIAKEIFILSHQFLSHGPHIYVYFSIFSLALVLLFRNLWLRRRVGHVGTYRGIKLRRRVRTSETLRHLEKNYIPVSRSPHLAHPEMSVLYTSRGTSAFSYFCCMSSFNSMAWRNPPCERSEHRACIIELNVNILCRLTAIALSNICRARVTSRSSAHFLMATVMVSISHFFSACHSLKVRHTHTRMWYQAPPRLFVARSKLKFPGEERFHTRGLERPALVAHLCTQK